ncbi:hypothetical protein BCR37DRAFT_15126 [Protomyces lactucae-debilis]|uniref:Extracellular membrane protein CFEM domain-containing protein n=1 Tax=Protomyces lactucae-debilis TaxID=2754530 RepID=A0A1Y2FWF8_PROLT|nr:uncharacterized protein BCR37DRAFT_15126 [Protomyces lactucae-debilis]ORY87877.1 hypothetical protein BCR37DRAFT_15126 [Protomyces lactucae-debilis]
MKTRMHLLLALLIPINLAADLLMLPGRTDAPLCRRVQIDLAKFLTVTIESCEAECKEKLMYTYFGDKRYASAFNALVAKAVLDYRWFRFTDVCMTSFFTCILKSEGIAVGPKWVLGTECLCKASLLIDKLEPAEKPGPRAIKKGYSCALKDVISRFETNSWQIYNATVLEELSCDIEKDCACDMKGKKICKGDGSWNQDSVGRFVEALLRLSQFFRELYLCGRRAVTGQMASRSSC